MLAEQRMCRERENSRTEHPGHRGVYVGLSLMILTEERGKSQKREKLRSNSQLQGLVKCKAK